MALADTAGATLLWRWLPQLARDCYAVGGHNWRDIVRALDATTGATLLWRWLTQLARHRYHNWRDI
eukprot:12344832-Prorocentrum_lima.AAC.1